jgi:hypothetical protein
MSVKIAKRVRVGREKGDEPGGEPAGTGGTAGSIFGSMNAATSPRADRTKFNPSRGRRGADTGCDAGGPRGTSIRYPLRPGTLVTADAKLTIGSGRTFVIGDCRHCGALAIGVAIGDCRDRAAEFQSFVWRTRR